MNLYEFIYRMTLYFTFITFVIIFVSVFVMYIAYNSIIDKWFSNKGQVSYDTLINQIQTVSKDNYFMNYGLWDSQGYNLKEANVRLVDYLFDKGFAGLPDKKNLNILDVGCGYGEQHSVWNKKIDNSCKLTAIDISEKQIEYARQKNPSVTYEVCDVANISTRYTPQTYDTVFCVESAFHYKERQAFFRDVKRLLKKGGRFIISDITLKDSYRPSIVDNIFIDIFSGFLHLPSINMIKANEWESQLSSQFKVIEFVDITEQTFPPYYMHFVKTYIKNIHFPQCITNLLSPLFQTYQPFSYRVAVLEKS